MEDKEYFLNYQKAFNTIYSNSEDCAFIKDTEYKYQAVTDNWLKFINASSPKDLLGKTMLEVAEFFPGCSSKMIEQLRQQDIKVQTQKKRGTYLDLVNYNGQSKICVHYKNPIINPDTNNCVGMRNQVTNLFLPHVVKTLFKLHGAKGLLIGHKNRENPLEHYPLSKTQHMVLFLALNNYSYSEIAILLNEFGYKVTPIRVNDYLEQLKLIFHVRNKTQLIEKAIGLNFHTFLPDGLFNKLGSIEVSDEEAIIIIGNES